MKAKRLIAMLLTLAMLLAIAPAAALAAGAGTASDYYAEVVGSETTLGDDSTAALEFKLHVNTNDKDLSALNLALLYDESVLTLSYDDGYVVDEGATDFVSVVEKLIGRNTYNASGSGFKKLPNNVSGVMLSLDGGGSTASFAAKTEICSIYFTYKEGKSIADLKDGTVRLANKEVLGGTQADKLPQVDAFGIDDGVNSFCYGTSSTSKEDNMTKEQIVIRYPRSTATSAVTLTGTGVVAAEDGSVSFVAPEVNKQYTATEPLAIPEVAGLDASANETATIIAGSISGDTSVVDFSIANESGAYQVTSDKAVPNTYAGDTASVVINVTGDNGNYSKTVPVTIPKVKLPSWQLNPDSVTLLEKESGNWTVNDALAAVLIDDDAKGLHNAGWRLLAESDNMAEADWTLMTGTEELTVTGSPYTIPVFKAGVAQQNDDTAALLTVSITAAPTQGDADDNITADGAYTSTTTSITFTKATNPGWEYAVIEASNSTTDVTSLTYQRGVAPVTEGENQTAGGVTFTGLTPGTAYNLVVRAATADATSTPVRSTADAVTKYDLEVRTAYIKSDSSQADILKTDAEGGKYTQLTTKEAITAENVGNYTQIFKLVNSNGKAIFDVAVDFIDATTANAFTATIDYPDGYDADAGIASGELFGVEVTPATGLAKGVHSAKLVVTAKDAKDGNEILRKTIPVELTVYGGRAGTATGTDDIVLKPANLKTTDASVKLAKANTAIKLDVTWDGAAADSYEQAVVAAGREGEPYAIQKGSELDASITTDLNGAAIDADATYLVLTQDIKELGLLSTVNAVFDEKADSYLIKQEAPVKVFVKAAADDILTDENGDPMDPKIQEEYTVVIPSDTAIDPIDLTGGIDGVTVTEDQAVTGATLTSGSLAIDNTTATGGEGHYTVVVPDSDQYTNATFNVKVYLLEKQDAQELNDIDLVTTEIDATNNKIELPVIAGATYTVTKGAGLVTEEELTAEGDGKYYVTLPDSVTAAAQIEVSIAIPAVKGPTEYKAEAASTQKIMIRQPAEFTGTFLYEYDDINKPAGDVTMNAAVAGAGVTYTLKSGSAILNGYNNVDHFSLADPTAYGKAVITATSGETDTYAAGSKDIEIYVRKPNDGGAGDPTDPELEPTYGTNANILGAKVSDADNYIHPFDKHMDETSTGDYDMWSESMYGAKITGLTKGVRYEVRFILSSDADTMSWYKGPYDLTEPPAGGPVDEDGWWTLSKLGDENGAVAEEFTLVPASDDTLVTVQIRYKDDGTVGDTTTDETDDHNWVIHGLNPELNYQYRVADETGWDTTFTGANENGWIDLPMKDAVDDTKDGNTGLKMYTVTREYVIADVETRYTSKPSASTDEDGDFIITGLVPNANYDLAPTSEVTFKEDPVNYHVIRADGDGKIVIVHATEEYTFLELDQEGVTSVLIRLSKTDTTLPGEGGEVNTGVTVSGVVSTFAPNREGRVMLYPYTEDGVAPTYYDVHSTVYETELQGTFGGADQATSSTAVDVNFQIESVPAGTYLLVVVKPGNTHFVVENLVVGNEDVDLTATTYPTEVQSMTLIPGDINGDGLIEGNDSGILYRSVNWRKSGDDINNVACDINGDGMVEGNDSALIYRSAHWRKGDVKVTLP